MVGKLVFHILTEISVNVPKISFNKDLLRNVRNLAKITDKKIILRNLEMAYTTHIR